MAQGGSTTRKDRLTSWKAVGAFLGRSESTVRRWEAERGLPVHRMPGTTRSGIYVEVAELEAWLKNGGDAEPEVPAEAVTITPPKQTIPWRLIAAGMAAVVLAGVSFSLWHRPAPVSAAARALYLQGTQDWQARTPASLNRAVGEFTQATRLDPDYAEAYAGLANCYNLLPEYTSLAPSKGYALAEVNARRAIELDDRIASAHAALAFAEFFGSWKAADARREYQRALALDPDNANVEHWYATFLMSTGDYAEAMTHIDRALALNPDSISIQADRGMVQVYVDPAAAHTTLTALEAAHPDFRSIHAALSYLYMTQGDDAAFLREAAEDARLLGNDNRIAYIVAAQKGLDAGGHDGMLRAMLKNQLDQYAHGTTSALEVAALYTELGDHDNALAYVKLAFDRHDDGAVYILSDKRFTPLHDSPAWRAQVARLSS